MRINKDLMRSLGLGLLSQQTGPSRTPITGWQTFGRGLASGFDRYNKMQDRQSKLARQEMEDKQRAEQLARTKAYLQGLPEPDRLLAQVMGPGEYAKTEMTNRSKVPAMVATYNSRTGLPEYVSKSLIGTEGYDHIQPIQARPKGESDMAKFAQATNRLAERRERPKLNRDYTLIEKKNADGTISYTSEVVPGSKADLENQEKKLARYERGFAYAQTLDRAKSRLEKMKGAVGSALNIATDDKETTMGLMGRIFEKVPGTQAYTLKNYLDSLRAMSGLDQLNQMRMMAQASGSTGSGLGQVTEKEHAILQKQWANLDPASKNFKEELQKYMESAEGALKRVQKAFNSRVKIGSFNKDFLEKYNESNADQEAANAGQSSTDPKALTVDQLLSLPENELKNLLPTLSREKLEALKAARS